MNEQVIESLLDFKDSVLTDLSQKSIMSFHLGDLDFDVDPALKGIQVGDNIIADKALQKIFTSLRVKNNFLEYKKDMDKDDWKEIQNILKNANQKVEFWGKKALFGDGSSKITDIFQNKYSNTMQNSYEYYFDFLIKAMQNSPYEFQLKDTNFNKNDESVGINLLVQNSNIDLFKNGSDIWKSGVHFNWDMVKFETSPYFARQICSNGMIAEQRGYKSNIQNKKFNLDVIEKNIEKLVISVGDKFDEIIIDNANHLKSNNASLREFYDIRKFFEKRNGDDEKYSHIIDTYFNDNLIYKNYGEDIKERSKKWLSTGDSGRNLYDLFNNLTALGTHKERFHVEPEDAKELQIIAGNIFLKEDFDLEDVAPSMNFNIDNPMPDTLFKGKN